MRHGKSLRKLSRPSAHRMLMLRNMVSSLLQHQQIKTTLAKAKEAAPLAEKMITLAKRGTVVARKEIESFVLNPADTIPKLYSTYVPRYASRPGGYTRIHHFNHRPGDAAPMAILELVDNPQDLRFAMTARAVGRETLGWFVRQEQQEQRWGAQLPVEELELAEDEHGRPISSRRQPGIEEELERELDGSPLNLASGKADRFLRPVTLRNREKVLKYRGKEGAEELNKMARQWVGTLMHEPEVWGGLRKPRPQVVNGEVRLDVEPSKVGRKVWAGERLTGMDVAGRVGLGLAKGALGRRPAVRQSFAGWTEQMEEEVWEEVGRRERELEEERVEKGPGVGKGGSGAAR